MHTPTPKQSSPLRTLSVLAVTLALLVWLRHDALDSYWLQTRHSRLGLSDITDNSLWADGVKWSNALATDLAARQDQSAELGSRLTLAANIVINGPGFARPAQPLPVSALATTLVPSTSINIRSLAGVDAPVKSAASASSTPPGAAGKTSTANSASVPNVASALNAGSNDKGKALASASASVAASVAAVPASAPANTSHLDAAPLSEDGRIVLTPQDKVLMVGDSMMQGVAPYVARALQKSNITTIDLSKQSTGLAYPTYFDWPATIQKTIPAEKITVMVVFLGANDTWDLIIGGRDERFGTDKWKSVYSSRVEAMVKFAESQHVRVIWLGAPNMGREKINTGVKLLNQLYAAQNKDGMARYLSTRELLGGGDTDVYQKHITKADGKIVTVRTDDGIHFTPTGQTMLSDLILRQFVLPPAEHKSS